jgi:hypothetical protein
LIADIKDRQMRRQDTSPIYPTPYKQVNHLTNAGGYAKASILVILDKPKAFKTGMLANIARGYLRMRKKVLIIDLENGEDEFIIRIEQAVLNKSKSQVLSGEHDKSMQKALRKYKRLNSELVIKRMPAYTTTAKDIGVYMDYLYKEFGFRADILIVDFIAKMGCLSGKDSLHERISEAYVDVNNLALERDIIHVWTAQHVKTSAELRERTRYRENDAAGSIDSVRHIQAMFGLNRSKEEEENNIQRMEVVAQQDGKKGRAVFWVDADTQRAREFTHDERKEFDEQFRNIEEDDEPEKPRYQRRAKTDLDKDV